MYIQCLEVCARDYSGRKSEACMITVTVKMFQNFRMEIQTFSHSKIISTFNSHIGLRNITRWMKNSDAEQMQTTEEWKISNPSKHFPFPHVSIPFVYLQ